MNSPFGSTVSRIDPPRPVWARALPTKLSKTCSIRSRSTRMGGRPKPTDPVRLIPASTALFFVPIHCLAEEVGRRGRLEIELHPSLLDPCQVKQIVDHRENPLGVLACAQEQLRLLRVERADGFLEQEMDDHLEPVSGVFSSWLTVETMSLLSWSTSRNLVTSASTTAAPRVPSSSLRMDSTRGRKYRSWPCREGKARARTPVGR